MPKIKWGKKKGEKRLKDKEPKVFELTKKAFLVRSRKTSELSTSFLNDIYMLKKPDCMKIDHRVDIQPFEDDSQLEFLSRAKEMSLFASASHTKKRPNTVTIGRMFDYHVLDMVELVLDPTGYRSVQSFPSVFKPQVGNKPCFMFTGDAFENDIDFKNIKNILVDFFHGENTRHVNLEGISHIMSFVALPDRKIRMAVYAIVSPVDDEEGDDSKEGKKRPAPDAEEEEDDGDIEDKEDKEDDEDYPEDDPMKGLTLREIGPRITMQVNRVHFANDSLAFETRQLPKQLVGKRQKNVDKRNILGTTGTVFPKQQDLGKITRKVKLGKALRTPKKKARKE